jgi:hypothetical protein
MTDPDTTTARADDRIVVSFDEEKLRRIKAEVTRLANLPSVSRAAAAVWSRWSGSENENFREL